LRNTNTTTTKRLQQWLYYSFAHFFLQNIPQIEFLPSKTTHQIFALKLPYVKEFPSFCSISKCTQNFQISNFTLKKYVSKNPLKNYSVLFEPPSYQIGLHKNTKTIYNHNIANYHFPLILQFSSSLPIKILLITGKQFQGPKFGGPSRQLAEPPLRIHTDEPPPALQAHPLLVQKCLQS